MEATTTAATTNSSSGNGSIIASNTTYNVDDGYVYPFYVAILFTVVSLCITLENVLGVVVIWLNPALHTTTNMFVCSMAVTDIATSLFSTCSNCLGFLMVIKVVSLASFVQYLTVMTVIVFIFLIFSMVHMAIIAFERYVFIAHPFVYRRRVTTNTIAVILSLVWAMCIAYVALLFGANSMAELTSLFIQAGPIGNNISYMIAPAVYVVTCLMTGVAYCLIIRLATKRSRVRLKNLKNNLKNCNNSVSQKEESWKSALKSIKFFVLVFGIYLVLTVPPFCAQSYHSFHGDIPSVVLQGMSVSFILISAVNFLVLFALNVEFRSAVKKTLARCCGRHGRNNITID